MTIKSKCCNAGVTVHGEVTHYHICKQCGKPCDVQSSDTRGPVASLPDELVERVAKLLFHQQCPYFDWDRLEEIGDAVTARQGWYKLAKHHLKALSEPLSDGSRVLRVLPLTAERKG